MNHNLGKAAGVTVQTYKTQPLPVRVQLEWRDIQKSVHEAWFKFFEKRGMYPQVPVHYLIDPTK